MAASDNLNQAQFDKKFKDIALNETVRGALQAHKETFEDMGPIHTTVAAPVSYTHLTLPTKRIV